MIEEKQLVAIGEQVSAHGIDEQCVSALRAAWPGIHFTYCCDDDITSGKPVAEYDDFNIYLVDGRDHCLCLTNDFNVATGIVLAEVIDDE